MKKKQQIPARGNAYSAGDGVARAAGPSGQPQIPVFPAAQPSATTYVMPNTCGYAVAPNGMPLGLPTYSSVDEYGRVFTPIVTYGPQPNSAPVPVATPAKIVQLTPIVSPVAFVPYSTQNQGLYQYDEDNE